MKPSSPDWAGSHAQAQAALATGDAARAIAVLAPASRDPSAPIPVLRLLAATLRSHRRNREALAALERLVALQPLSAVAEHNLAAALGDTGNAPRAEVAARRALAKGGDAPETWLVLGRALLAQSRLAEAKAALEEALRRRPGYGDALRDMAQLIWMQTGDASEALRPLEAALATREGDAVVRNVHAALSLDILGPDAAYRGLESGLAQGVPGLHLTAAAAALEIDPALALRHAQTAASEAPHDPRARNAHSSALIAAGHPAEALARLEEDLHRSPLDQYALALRLTAWRVLGDGRALQSSDYETLCQAYGLQLEDKSEALERAAEALRRLHPFSAQPLGQSIRSGVQAALDPRYAGEPAIDAVFAALDRPIGTYVAAMAGRDDPMSRRATTGHEIVGAWSVKLTAGGRHSDHVHPNGWVSSALYISTPEPDPADPKAGWLRFGAVRLGVGLDLPAEHWIEPKPGVVCLFPSWMWHGTEPFSSAGERLTIAFDVQPG